MQHRKVSLLLLLSSHLAAGVVGLVGLEERNMFITHTKLPLCQQRLRTALRGAGRWVLLVAVGQEQESFCWLLALQKRNFCLLTVQLCTEQCLLPVMSVRGGVEQENGVLSDFSTDCSLPV